MRLLDESAPWLRNMCLSTDEIVCGQGGQFGVGAVLVIEHEQSRRLLFVKKAYRLGFEGNDQFAFPGGMVRSNQERTSLSSKIWTSLAERVAAEVSLDLQSYRDIAPLEGQPPVVAVYTAKGQRRRTVILPFVLTISQLVAPCAQDSTVYDAQWLEPLERWAEITPTNRLIAAYYLWSRLSETERARAQPSLAEALRQSTEWAREAQLPSPVAPWLER